MEILKTHNLKKYYGEGSTVVKALDGVNLSAQKGEFAAIVDVYKRQVQKHWLRQTHCFLQTEFR